MVLIGTFFINDSFNVDELRMRHVLDISGIFFSFAVFVQVDVGPVLVVVDFVVFDCDFAVGTDVVGLGRVDGVDVFDRICALN